MPNVAYNAAKLRLVTGQVNWTNSSPTIWGLLLVGSTSPTAALNPDLVTVQDLLAQLGASEASGTGYTRLALVNRGATQDNTADKVVLTADPMEWSAIDTGIIQTLVVYEKGSTDALSNLLFGLINGFPKATNGAPFNIFFPNGVATL